MRIFSKRNFKNLKLFSKVGIETISNLDLNTDFHGFKRLKGLKEIPVRSNRKSEIL